MTDIMIHPFKNPLDAAMEYNRLGMRVILLHGIQNGKCTCSKGSACSHPGKHPKTLNGLKDATSELSVICKWFRGKKYVNIGIVTGSISNLIVVDVDVKTGGLESLKKLNLDKRIPMVRTGSGGFHLYYRYPEIEDRIKNSVSKIAPGIDIRADGGLVVAPPSMHISGKPYEWIKEYPENV